MTAGSARLETAVRALCEIPVLARRCKYPDCDCRAHESDAKRVLDADDAYRAALPPTDAEVEAAVVARGNYLRKARAEHDLSEALALRLVLAHEAMRAALTAARKVGSRDE